jgi:beta-glucosidase
VTIFVAGEADNVGMQCGGWTLVWQGRSGNEMPGTSILAGIKQTASQKTRVEYNRDGKFEGVADIGIVVVGEQPYSEGRGDRADLSLLDDQAKLIDRVKAQSKRVVVILISGRPMIVADQLPKWDAFVAAWLPGTEGQGVADVLFGDYDFVGKLPYTWPRWNSQLPLDLNALPTKSCAAPLFPYGFGLTMRDESPQQPNCPKP